MATLPCWKSNLFYTHYMLESLKVISFSSCSIINLPRGSSRLPWSGIVNTPTTLCPSCTSFLYTSPAKVDCPMMATRILSSKLCKKISNIHDKMRRDMHIMLILTIISPLSMWHQLWSFPKNIFFKYHCKSPKLAQMTWSKWWFIRVISLMTNKIDI